MKTDINDKEIKKFYEGLSSRDEEQRLRGSEDPVVDALIEAREANICDIDIDSLPEIPGEYSARIEAILAKEMQREKRFGAKSVLFRRAIFAAGVAAALLLMLLCGKLFIVSDMSVPGDEIQKQSPAKDADSYIITGNFGAESSAESGVISEEEIGAKRTLQEPLQVAKMVAPKSVSNSESGRTSISAPGSASKSVESKMDEGDVSEDDFYLSPEEENELRADNYRVIENEAEANAIINAIFARIEANMMAEGSRLTEMADKFQPRRVIYKGN